MMYGKLKSLVMLGLVFIVMAPLLTSCAQPRIAQPQALTAPEPIAGNSGKYMCPYTSDGVMAEWTDKAVNAAMGSTIGKMAGTIAGQKAMEQIPFVGGFLGGMVGEAVGQKIAIESCGGWESIKETSDLSFNSLDDMSVYLYVKHSSHEHYASALKSCFGIYPDLEKAYYPALQNASSQN